MLLTCREWLLAIGGICGSKSLGSFPHSDYSEMDFVGFFSFPLLHEAFWFDKKKIARVLIQPFNFALKVAGTLTILPSRSTKAWRVEPVISSVPSDFLKIR